MKLRTYKPDGARRRALAALLLGLWLVCGLFCINGSANCPGSAPSTTAQRVACCQHHGSGANQSGDDTPDNPGSESACCDAVTKPAVASLPGVEAIPGLSGDAAATNVTTSPIAPTLFPQACTLPVDRAFRLPAELLLGVSHLPHGPPVRA